MSVRLKKLECHISWVILFALSRGEEAQKNSGHAAWVLFEGIFKLSSSSNGSINP
ncbi:hypothetical protein MKW98_024869, partial [Papaver atlanticum]